MAAKVTAMTMTPGAWAVGPRASAGACECRASSMCVSRIKEKGGLRVRSRRLHTYQRAYLEERERNEAVMVSSLGIQRAHALPRVRERL